MSCYRADRAEFLDIFPAEDRLINGYQDSSNEDGVLFVDVGGGMGHEIQKFNEKFTHKRGRIILQELPEVIDQVPESKAMEAMVHDFFTPQPVKGESIQPPLPRAVEFNLSI